MDGHPCYVAKQSIRYNLSWNHIHAVDLVFGKIIWVLGTPYTIRLMTGLDDSGRLTAGGEWNRLLYPIASSTDSLGWGINIPDTDLGVTTGNGRRSWCQDADPTNSSRRIRRGGPSVEILYSVFSAGNRNTDYGWRPILVPVV